MAQHISGYAYWISALVAQSGYPVRAELPKDERHTFRELARFLLANDFDDLVQLQRSPDPSEWVGAESLNQSQLELVRHLQESSEKGRVEVRYVERACHFKLR